MASTWSYALPIGVVVLPLPLEDEIPGVHALLTGALTTPQARGRARELLHGTLVHDDGCDASGAVPPNTSAPQLDDRHQHQHLPDHA
jgi:hypothetical protein